MEDILKPFVMLSLTFAELKNTLNKLILDLYLILTRSVRYLDSRTPKNDFLTTLTLENTLKWKILIVTPI